MEGLDQALNVDTVLWERELASWLARAEAWRATKAEEQPGKLLPIGELAEVNTWARRRPDAGPAMPPLVETFIRESAEKLDRDDKRRRRLSGIAFVKPAVEANARGEYEHALRLAATGAVLAEDVELKLVPELWSRLSNAIFRNRTDCIFQGHVGAVTVAAISPDGKRVITGSADNTARLWDVASGTEIAVLKAHSSSVTASSFKWIHDHSFGSPPLGLCRVVQSGWKTRGDRFA